MKALLFYTSASAVLSAMVVSVRGWQLLLGVYRSVLFLMGKGERAYEVGHDHGEYRGRVMGGSAVGEMLEQSRSGSLYKRCVCALARSAQT